MTNYRDDDENEPHPEQDAAQARVNVARWSPWVWIVPAVAILLVGWLIVRYGFFGGGDVTVRFVEARGLDRYSPVRFRGAKVGTVQKITIDENLSQVVVRITLDASMTHALRKNTRFWIVEPGLEGGGLGGILSGTYVGIAPGDGEEATEFVGQEYPPVMSAPEAGKTFILEGSGLGSLSAGTPVHFEGMRVGRVLGAEFDERRQQTFVHVFVVQRFANHVRQTTRFFRSGGLSFSLGGGGLQMGDASLASLLNAPVAFYTPDVLAGVPAADGSRFQLYNSRGAAIAAADGPHMTYLTYFPGSVSGLTPGTPVTMKGVQVGRVREVRLRFVPETASLETPVVIEIDPRELEFDVNASTTREELRGRLNDALQRLIHKGYRATLATSLVLPGASAVALNDVAGDGTGRLVTESDPPIIPAAATGDGLGGAMTAVTEIANTLRGTAKRLDTLLNDPRLDRSLARLDSSLAQVEKVANIAGANAGPIVENLRDAAESAQGAAQSVEATAKKAGQSVDPIVESLRNAAASAEQAAKRAEQLLGTSQKQNYDVAELIRELTRAAQAVRELSTYLSENPDSLIKGRRE
jgi:paraquat-inducible protein B